VEGGWKGVADVCELKARKLKVKWAWTSDDRRKDVGTRDRRAVRRRVLREAEETAEDLQADSRVAKSCQ
jgi:hypothetical protein